MATKKPAAKTAKAAAKPAPAVRANKEGDFGTFTTRKKETLRGKVVKVDPRVNGVWLTVRVGAKPSEHVEHIIRTQAFTRDKK